jgi:hypothetical protein
MGGLGRQGCVVSGEESKYAAEESKTRDLGAT